MVYILKSGNNYYELDLNAQTVQELKFYIIHEDHSVSQSVPDSQWISKHPPIQDIGGGSYVTFVIRKAKEYELLDQYGERRLIELGPRYILVGEPT